MDVAGRAVQHHGEFWYGLTFFHQVFPGLSRLKLIAVSTVGSDIPHFFLPPPWRTEPQIFFQLVD